jgi:large subunit ribosomal protein L15
MQLHQIKPAHKPKNKKRVGRGGKRGTYSGRGQKGQKSRAGRKIRPAVQDYIIRLPKLRGLGNKPVVSKPQPVNLSELNRRFENNAYISGKSFPYRVKILGKGNVTKSFIIEKGLPISKSARAKIEAAGGKIQA